MGIRLRYLAFPIVLMLALLPLVAQAQQQTATLSGTVTSGLEPKQGEEPEALEGVLVTLATAANDIDVIMAPYAADTVRRYEILTDKNGTFSFENIPPGDYVIFAEGEELASLAAVTLILEAGEEQVYDFSMTPGGSIIGEITSTNDIPIWGGTVTLFDRKLAVQSVFVRRNGAYLFEHVRPGVEYQIFVQTPTEVALTGDRLEVVEGEALELDLEVDLAARLQGRVVSDLGEPIKDALVSLEGDILRWSGLTDEDGFYDLRGAGIEYGTILPGEYNIRVRADRHVGLFEEAVDLTDPGRHTLNFTMERAGTITGVVLDGEGVPMEDAVISAVGETGSEYTTLTQYDGTYTLDLMEPDQPYTLTAFAVGYAPDQLDEVSAGKGETVGGVSFTLVAGTYVEGALTLGGAEPGSSAVVDFYNADGELFSAVAGDDGIFTFDGLEAGNYVVLVSTALQETGYAGTVSLAADDAMILELEMQESGILFGTIGGPGAVVVSFSDVIVSVTVTQDDGSFEILGLAPGDYEVWALNETGASEPVSVSIAAGDQIEQDLAIE